MRVNSKNAGKASASFEIYSLLRGFEMPRSSEREQYYLLRLGDRQALAEARKLIKQCGYHRRDGELADAEEALA